MASYYWKVVARDSNNAVTEGPIWRFTTGDSPAYTPVNPSPADGRAVVATNVYLTWDRVEDPDPDDAVSYDIHFGTSPTPPLIQADYPQNAYSLGDLGKGLTYYWKIVSKDDHGVATEGPMWTFETLEHDTIILQKVAYSTDTV